MNIRPSTSASQVPSPPFKLGISVARPHDFMLFILLLALCIGAPANALEQVTLQLKWVHQFQFAGYYAAKQQGYYHDAGLDVTILPATPGKDPVLDVIDGKAQYGVGTSSLLLLRNAGKPVVALAVIFQHSPYILLTKQHSASQTIHNLAGKRLMLEPQADELLAYLKKEGIPIEKMQMVDHSFNIKDLIDGKVDVISGYVTNYPYELEKARFAYHSYTPRSAGIDFYGDNLFTTESELKNNPARVKAFREASLKGWQYALQHPDKMIDHIISTYSSQLTRADLTYEASQIKQLMQPDLVEIGYMHPGRWRHIADTYYGLGMLPEDIDLKKFMFDPHPDKDLTTIYQIFVILCGVAVLFFVVRLIKITRNLKISEETFYKAFEYAPIMKVISNMDGGTLLNVNAKFCEVTGFSKDEAIGKSSTEIGLLTTKDRLKIVDAINKNSRFSDIELKLQTATGTMLDCVFFGELVKVGKTQQLLTVGLDVTEHKKSQLALIESNNRLQSLVSNVPGYVAYINAKDLSYEYVNDNFLDSFGLHRERVIGYHVKEIIGESNYNYASKYIDKVKLGESVYYENTFNLTSGKRWIEVHYNPIFDIKGDVATFIVLSFDITERKMAETYREITQNVLQLLNKPGDFKDSMQQVLDELKTKIEIDAVGMRLQEGNDFPYFAHTGFSNDFLITENTLINRTSDGMLCRENDGNMSLECTCGLVISGTTDPTSPLFTPGGSFWANDSFSLLDLPLNEDPRNNPRNKCMYQGYASIVLVPIRFMDRIIGLLQFNDRRKGCFTRNAVEVFEGIASHIGEAVIRKRSEDEKLLLEKQFHQAQKLESLGVLTGGIAHDFNNILTVILGHCFLGKENIGSKQEYKESFQEIENAAIRATELCRQMLAYAGRRALTQKRINLWLLVDEVVKMLQAAIKKNVTIELDLNQRVPEILGDDGQIQQIVMNFIINAAEAIGDKNGTIRVILTRTDVESDLAESDTFGTKILTGSYVCLEVTDTGCGMDEETQMRIFEPFYTTKATGRGLGMSAICGIVKSHAGILQLTSTPGIGTTFKVLFPVPVATDHPEVIQTDNLSLNVNTGGTILLVDDEQALRFMGETVLKAMGYSTLLAQHGREALAIFRELGSDIDVIIIDLIMPEMDGIEAYYEIRKIQPTVPIIFCSGYSVGSLNAIIDKDTHASFVHKPYNPLNLRDLIAKMMENTNEQGEV